LDWFTLSCDDPGLPTDGSNLVVKAATAMADALQSHVSRVGEGRTDRIEPVSAFLAKRIPSGAGLGGGSSDAAATLIGLNALWKLDWPASRLSEIAARIGSDVPFFLCGASSVCTGRGEVVRAAPAPDMKWATLVLPKIDMPTPAVYRRFDEMNLGREESVHGQVDWPAWSKLAAAELMPLLVNDLEPAAFSLRPELGELRSKLQRELSHIVRMSGSGSSLFTLCDDADSAASLAKRASASAGVDAMAVAVAPAAKSKSG
jgi:4-diphosphocytidyl-2C-methyl-D-erythritol kinase